MEQKPLSPDHGPDLPPVAPASSGETMAPSFSPESQPDNSVEHREQQGEAVHASGGATLPTITLPAPAAPHVDDTAVDPPQQIDGSSPTIANDDELIEKEWVERAKKVIVETKDDPYRREQEVNQLQADYLLKRYGRELGSL